MWDTLTHGRPWKGELINRRKNGELYWEEAQIAPVKDAAGSVTHYVAVKSDINARKKLESQNEEALSRLQKIASRVPGVVYQYLLRADGSARFPFASEAIREIYRVTPEEVREDASRVFSILHPDDIAEVASSIERSARTILPGCMNTGSNLTMARYAGSLEMPCPKPYLMVLCCGMGS